MWQRIPDLSHIGFPIADVSADGEVIITKAPGRGGRINFHTVRQQLLYEVHNPRCYVTPDVVLDMVGADYADLNQAALNPFGCSGHATMALLDELVATASVASRGS